MIDKIAYAGKDIEDAIEARIIKEENVPPKFLEQLGTTNGKIIGTFIEDMVKCSHQKDYIAISHQLGDLLHELIQFNSKHIYHSAQAEGYKEQAGKTLRYLFDDLLAQLGNTERFRQFRDVRYQTEFKSNPIVYGVLRDFVIRDMKDVYCANDPDELIILDFIAGMTDSFAIRSVSDVFVPKTTV